MLQRRRARVQVGVTRKETALSRGQRRSHSVSAPRFSAIKLDQTGIQWRQRLNFTVPSCMYVCHRGHYVGLSRCRLVGSCVLPGENFFYIGRHVKPRLHAWHSHRQSRSHFAFSSLSDQWEIRLFFHFSKLFFIQNYPFLYHGDQKISWWTSMQVASSQLRNPPVKFRHECWLHLAIDQHPACPNRGRLELWPRKWFLLGRNPWR